MKERFAKFINGDRVGSMPGKSLRLTERVVYDTRKPIYLVLILDKSGSMAGVSTVYNEVGEAVQISKIDQLNDGVKRVIASLKKFEEGNPLYRLYLQIIELDSYGKAVFPEFQPIARGIEEIKFEADGCTELRASLNTLKKFINHQYLRDDRPGREGKGYNKAVSVILMSDGWPTDSNGIEQSGPAYRNVIDEFNSYLTAMDYARNVDKYSMAVGDDACEDMLRYFADGDENLGENSRFYRVEACESIASALDYLTRATLAHHTAAPIADDLDVDDLDEETVKSVLDTEDNANTVTGSQPNADTATESNENAERIVATGSESKYHIDADKCRQDKCMACIDKCPLSAIKVHSGIVEIDEKVCNGCGICESECGYGAVHTLIEVEVKDIPDDLYDDLD